MAIKKFEMGGGGIGGLLKLGLGAITGGAALTPSSVATTMMPDNPFKRALGAYGKAQDIGGSLLKTDNSGQIDAMKRRFFDTQNRQMIG